MWATEAFNFSVVKITFCISKVSFIKIKIRKEFCKFKTFNFYSVLEQFFDCTFLSLTTDFTAKFHYRYLQNFVINLKNKLPKLFALFKSTFVFFSQKKKTYFFKAFFLKTEPLWKKSNFRNRK